MATIYLSTGAEMSVGCSVNGNSAGDRPKLQSCVSIVVDDVDGDDTNGSCPEPSGSQHHHHHHHQQLLLCGQQPPQILDGEVDVFDDNADARSDVSHGSRSSRGSTSKEESEFRIQQIKDEIRHRRDEFARLLDEHEQVVRELRRIESSGELQTMVGEMGSGRTEEALPGFSDLKQEE